MRKPTKFVGRYASARCRAEYYSQWAAVVSIADRIGATVEAKHIKNLERELRKTNERAARSSA